MDKHYWLHDKENPEVLRFLREENEYARRVMQHTTELQKSLYREMRARIDEEDVSVPVRDGDHFYYRRTEPGRQYYLYCRRAREPRAAEEVVLDLNEVARGYDYCDLGTYAVSPDHSMLAWSADTSGNERYTLRFKNLDTGKELDDVLTDIHWQARWANDSSTLFYTTLDDTMRPCRLWRHRIGTSQTDDALVYEEPDLAFRLRLTRTRSGRYLLLRLESQVTTEVHVLDADRPDDPFRLVQPRSPGVEYYLLHHGDRFFILTNHEAMNFKLAEAPIDRTSRDNWRDVVAHRETVLIEDAEVFANHLVLFERESAQLRVRVMDLRSLEQHVVAFDESLYTIWSGRNPEFDTHIIRLVYSSLVTPRTVIDYNMEERTFVFRKREIVMGGYDASAYHSERLFAPATDGVHVPVSIVYKKGLKRDGSNPLVLYGYGAYGESQDPEFESARLSLLDRGFVYAIAHVRGGAEMGRQWYEDGKLDKKINTFTDFIDCAKYLIAERYTSSERLVIEGFSAGGLLIGAVINMRPDLFAAAVADVPFVDVVSTMMDESIPLTVNEYDEWGNPVSKDVREYIRSYSPVDNVRPQEYPHMLVLAGFNDPRVHYWEPAKWTLRLRQFKTDDNLLLLLTRFDAGHFGPTGRYEYLREYAFELAFILEVLGLIEQD